MGGIRNRSGSRGDFAGDCLPATGRSSHPVDAAGLELGATRTNNLSIAGAGTLDLSNHELLLSAAAPAGIKAALAHAYDPNGNADWGLSGLTSSVAKANPISFSVAY